MKIEIERDTLSRSIIAFLFIFPFIGVNGLYVIEWIDIQLIHNAMSVAVIVPILCIYAQHFTECRNYGIWAAVWAVTIFFCTLMNDVSNLGVAVFYGLRMFAFFAVFDIYLSLKDEIIISVLDNYLTVLFAINLYFQFYNQEFFGYTESMNFRNFFVSDNQLPYYALGHLVVIIVRYRGQLNLFNISKIAIDLLSLIKAWCASGVIAMVITVGLIIFFTLTMSKIRIKMIYQIIFFFAVHIVMFSSATYRFIDKITLALFNKTIGTSRSSIWTSALKTIQNSVIYGYGTTRGGRMSINYVSRGLGGRYYFAHNWSLEYLIQGGILLFAVYMALIILCLRETEKYISTTSKMLLIVIFGYQVACLTEAWIVYPTSYLVYIMCLYSSNYKNEWENEISKVGSIELVDIESG